MKLKNQDSAYPLLATLKKLGRPLTRENYLALYGWDNPKPDLTAEEELDLPPQFRRSSCPTEEDPVEKLEMPEVTPEEEALLPLDFQRPDPMTPAEFQKWKLENWLRCRCEGDDLFDMCLNCITHRQLTDLIQ